MAEAQEEFKITPGDPDSHEKGAVGGKILARLIEDKTAFQKDPAAYLQAMVNDQLVIKEKNGDFSALDEAASSRAREQARVGISLEMQRRLGWTEPRLFSNAYKNEFKAKYEAAKPMEKAALLQSLNQNYDDLAGQAMTELGFNHYARTVAGLLTNPSAARDAGLMLELEDRSLDSLLQGQTGYAKSEVESLVSRQFANSQLGRTMQNMIGSSPDDYSLGGVYQSSLEAMGKLTAYYVGTGKSLKEASSLALKAFTSSYNAISDDNKAIMLPADLDYDKVNVGLDIAQQSLLEQHDAGRGVWRNMGGDSIGMFDPDGEGWLLGPDGKPIQFSLSNLESLGQEGKVMVTPSDFDLGTGVMYSPGRLVPQINDGIKARVEEMLNKPRASLAGQYRDMQFSALPPGRAGLPFSRAGKSAALVQGQREDTPRGERNNNPGNLRISNTDWQGKIAGADSEFETFETPEHGIRAAAKNALTLYRRDGADTVTKMISQWAPATENDTRAYIKSVAAELGVEPDQRLDFTDREILLGLAKAIFRHENGRLNYSDEQIAKGVDAVLGRVS
jgi:hypothetical protein